MVCGISSLCTGEDSLSVIRGSPKVRCLLSQVLHDGVTAWPWHNAHYLAAVLNGLPDTSSSSLKIPQVKSFFVFKQETFSGNPKCPLDCCSPDKLWFWQTGGSQLFLDCLVGAVSQQKKKKLTIELPLQFLQMAEEVRMNNTHGRKMLISEKRRGHDLTLLEVVFKLRKHQSVYQISSLPPSYSPHGLPSTSLL